MKVRLLLSALAALGGALAVPSHAQDVSADVAGEISTKTALLQSRITEAQRKVAGIGDRVEGWARFEAADNAEFDRPVVSDWVKISAANNFIAKGIVGSTRITLRDPEGNILKDEKGRTVTPATLKDSTKYYWRVRYGASPSKLHDGAVHTFTTLSGALASRSIRIAVVQGIDLGAANAGTAFNRVAATKPDYVVFAGNSVAYDLPKGSAATTEEAMQKRWHTFFAQKELGELVGQVGTYWEKNDRDFRFNDADPLAAGQPSADLGASVFRQQVPVVDLFDAAALTFRHPQFTRDLEIWLPEVRDYRSANSATDNKDKSLWGTFQSEWVVGSLKTSSVPFKLFIQPTPILGPSLPGDSDSHAGDKGFGTERAMFLRQAKELKLAEKTFVILTGSPWQYHSVNAEGIDEISIGSLTTPYDGPIPAAGGVAQPFVGKGGAAGFALVEITPAVEGGATAKLTISLIRSDSGEVVYKLERMAK